MPRNVEVNFKARDPQDPLLPLMPSALVVQDVLTEAFHALEKHGPPTTDPVRACAILAEELGEITEHALRMTSRDERERCGQSSCVRLLLMRTELCQLAAYALLQIHNIDIGGFDHV